MLISLLYIDIQEAIYILVYLCLYGNDSFVLSWVKLLWRLQPEKQIYLLQCTMCKGHWKGRALQGIGEGGGRNTKNTNGTNLSQSPFKNTVLLNRFRVIRGFLKTEVCLLEDIFVFLAIGFYSNNFHHCVWSKKSADLWIFLIRHPF